MLPSIRREEEVAALTARLAGTPLAGAVGALFAAADRACAPGVHGDLARWQAALAALPALVPGEVACTDTIRIGRREDADDAARAALERALRAFVPWRKGPFELFGVFLDTEWRCDLKWQRVLAHCAPLAGRRVLDVGGGNGYYALRMLAQDPALVLGLDPYLLYYVQFLALRRYLPADLPVHLMPLPLEALPADAAAFDSVFSMGVLYHRRSPMDHLLALRRALRPGGQLVLETLVIDAPAGQVLVPEGRYASMRNVWFIPSPGSLAGWLRKAGLRAPRLVDLTATTPQEQRTTAWMPFRSLRDFLDPDDPGRTREGHPAPLRAVMLAEAP